MGLITRAHVDGGDLTLNRIQDVEPILNRVAAMRSMGDVGTSEMKIAGIIPKVIIEGYCKRWGITLHEFMLDDGGVHSRRILEDPSLSAYRVWQGKI